MLDTSICTSFISKNTLSSNKNIIEEEFKQMCYMTKFCKIDISLLYIDFAISWRLKNHRTITVPKSN